MPDDTPTDDLSFYDVAVAAPLVANVLAFAFVVGYFYAFDISWFAFFSLSEHLVFALRSLPIGIGGAVAFLIAVRFSRLEQCWTWLQGKEKLAHKLWFWLMILVCLLAFLSLHFGLAAAFLGVAIGDYFYVNLPPRRPFVKEFYWAINLMIASLMIGFFSANAWRLWQYPVFDRLAPYPTVIVIKNKPVSGRVIFAGSSGVLLYDHRLTGIRFIKLQDIDAAYECHPPGQGVIPIKDIEDKCSPGEVQTNLPVPR
jgi:hypothetical protein